LIVNISQFVGLQLNLRYNKDFFSEHLFLKSALEFLHSTFNIKAITERYCQNLSILHAIAG